MFLLLFLMFVFVFKIIFKSQTHVHARPFFLKSTESSKSTQVEYNNTW